jgi:hypothetical protein
MNRRELLTKFGTLMLVLPAGRVLVACGGSSYGGSSTTIDETGSPSPTPTSGNTETLSFTSSVDAGHDHMMTLEVSLLIDSPTDGVSKTTTLNSAHTHRVEISEEQLDQIQAGQTLSIETSLVNGHTHSFQLQKGGL